MLRRILLTAGILILLAARVSSPQASAEDKVVLKPEGKVASFIRIWGQESPVTKELHHLLSEYCEDYQNSPAQFIRDMDMYSRRRGLHMISDTENETRGYTFQRELSKEDLLKYLSSTSFGSGMMEENPDGVRAKIVEPLWQFAHKEGFVTKNDKLKVAYEVQMTAGPSRITRDERIQREAETPAFVLR